MSLSGNTNTNTALCNVLKSQSSDRNITGSNVSFTICIVQTLNSSETKEIFCKSSNFINQTQIYCNQTILTKLNRDIASINNYQFFADILRNLTITFRWNKLDQPLKSNDIKISYNIKQLIRDSFHITMTVNASLDVAMVYRARCLINYYGTNCENHCISMDNISGHYNCTDEGKRVCLPGWRGIACNEAQCNECINGRCFAPNKCKCFNGWNGSTCKECQKRLGCQHGTCSNGHPFTCDCSPGWGGQNCDIDLKYCTNHQGLCQNNGICYSYYKDSRLQYVCTCEPGYSGRNCQIKTGDCIYQNCSLKNCSQKLSGSKCQCYPGHSGSYCQINNTIQLEFQSMQKNMKSGGFCLNSEEGYSCSCSKHKVEICQCRFNKCPQNTVCSNQNKPNRFCSNNNDINVQREFYINFGLEHFSLSSVVTQRPVTDYRFTKDPYLKFYIGSFVFIPILLGVILLVVIKFIFKFRKKSPMSVKTIHNDLCLPNNIVHKSVNYPEKRFLLNQLPLSTSHQSDKCLNNIFVMKDPTINDLDSKDISWTVQESENVDKSTMKTTVVCNPNLLINHYKDLRDNGK